uniref:E3 ubiquitin-protein ligase RNF168 n=1 Tax=Pan troglodytes TaxID=9598 RepID=A0A2I3TMH3_PANTR
MALPKDAIPSLSECQCGICMEILVEPVTLPCNHTLCKPCFQSTVEKASLCCPFCRRRVSSWTRYHTRRNSLVNVELWKIIQKHYPRECKLRASGQESEEVADDYQPVRLLSKPGELRREYEEEISKVAAERRASEEEENKASEEYIQRLLAEEEEEEKRQAEKRRRAMEEQLKSDEELARKLSIDINNFCEGSISASPLNSRKSDPVTPKSEKKSKNKQRNTGDIQKYLTPKSQFGSASHSEAVQEVRKNSVSKVYIDSSDRKSQQEDMPTLSPQISLGIGEQGADSSIESPMPWLCACGTSNHGKELCVLSHERPKTRVPYSKETAVMPCGRTESGCAPTSGVTQQMETTQVRQKMKSREISKRKNQESSFEAVKDHAFLQKEEKSSTVMALQLQKEVDKEQMVPNRQKRIPDEYHLRAASSPPDKVLNGQRKNPKDGTSKGKLTQSIQHQRGVSLKMQLKQSKMPNSTRDHCKVSKSAHSLQPSISQKSVFQMFQRCTK